MVRAKGRVRRGFALPGLRRERENAGLSLRELEEKSIKNGEKVWRATINEIERGNRDAHPRTARRLANAMDVSIEDLRRPDGE